MPARVVTSPVATTILRMVWLLGVRDEEVAAAVRRDTVWGRRTAPPRRCRQRNRHEPAVPARVVTAPVATTILRMVWLLQSATKRLPLPSAATPKGW